MENFFDIATVEELKEQFDGILPDAETLARQREMCASNADCNLELLTYLFVARGEFGKAQTCLRQISDGTLRSDTGRMIAHDPKYLDWTAQHSTAG